MRKEIPNTNKLKEIKTSIAPWKSPLTPVQARRRSYHKDWTLPFNTLAHKKKYWPIRELCDKELTIKPIHTRSSTASRHIFGNPSTMQQALGEENSKNI